MSEKITINPIGTIEAENSRFVIRVDKAYRSALKELDGFGHITVIWWGNKTDSEEIRKRLVAEKPYKKGPETIGVFATRSEVRPNPVLITTTSLLHVDLAAGTIDLPWIDAESGTPVIDIKPYTPALDRINNYRLPEWQSSWPGSLEESASFDWGAVFNF